MPSDAAHISTLALGTHPSALSFLTVSKEPFDFICQGEGPLTITGLLGHGPDKIAGILKVPGLWMRGDPGDIIHSAPAQNITDLDTELPGQAWELLDLKKYRAHNWHLWTGDRKGGYASVQTSLGCPFRCTFCCINAPFTTGGEAPRLRKW